MRFIHIADVHLGARPDKDRPWGAARAKEINDTFDKVLAITEERRVELLLIAGDLYDSVPSEDMLREVDEKLCKLSVTRTVIIMGSSDAMLPGSAALSYEFKSNTVLLPAGQFSNAYMADINTCITGLSYDRRECVNNIYDDIAPQVKDATNILLAYGGDENHAPMNYKMMAGAGFDYIALGHMHKAKQIVKNKIAYPGSLEPVDVSETGRRGFIYGQIKDGVTRIKWEPINARSYMNLGLPLKPSYNTEKVCEIISEQIEQLGTKNIYRIVLSGVIGDGVRLDFDSLTSKYNIYDVVDNAICNYNLTKLSVDHEDNILGRYIKAYQDKDGELYKKALKYGVEAMIATGEK